uniref:Uncharacterized protein n=1 Tax=Oryzias latipes TaxID=8090 RepID=A0A3P9M6P1_ORYLA
MSYNSGPAQTAIVNFSSMIVFKTVRGGTKTQNCKTENYTVPPFKRTNTRCPWSTRLGRRTKSLRGPGIRNSGPRGPVCLHCFQRSKPMIPDDTSDTWFCCVQDSDLVVTN